MTTLKPPWWIETIEPEDATSDVSEVYQRVGSVHDKIHNLYRAFSLQPKPLISADQHYRDILHNEANHTEPWLLELLATQAAMIADCHYALQNHGANFKNLLGDKKLGELMLDRVRKDDFNSSSVFTRKQAALLSYGAKLCRNPEKMCFKDIETLRDVGVTDTEILEAVQSTACFAYWVRFINALGVSLGDETIGFYDDFNQSSNDE